MHVIIKLENNGWRFLHDQTQTASLTSHAKLQSNNSHISGFHFPRHVLARSALITRILKRSRSLTWFPRLSTNETLVYLRHALYLQLKPSNDRISNKLSA